MGLATAAVAEPYWGGDYCRPYYAGYGCCATTGANVYGHWGDRVAAGTRTWYTSADGAVGTYARGGCENYRTGTTGSYAAGRSYNPYTGTAQRGYGRTFDTPGGTSGSVERGERYNPATGTRSYSSRATATGPGGSTVSRETGAAERGGQTAVAHQTTFDNARTGETHTVDTARVGNNLYAGADGHVYSNTGGGWQEHGGDGWHAAGGDTSWADREQQARVRGTDRVGGFGQGGWGGDRFDRSGGGGFGGGGFGGFRGRR